MRRISNKIGAPRLLILLIFLSFIIFFSQQALLRHARLESKGYDLGNADQAIWNTAHGRPFKFTNWIGKDAYILQASRLGMHVEPILLLIAPLYWIWEDVRVLLVLQACVAGLGGLGIWLVAKQALRPIEHSLPRASRPRLFGSPISDWAALALATAFWLNPGLQSAVLDDFHAVTLAAGLLPFAICLMLKKRYESFIALAVLIAATKEEMPLVGALMGLYVLVQFGWRDRGNSARGKAVWVGALVFMVGIAWLATAFLVIIPHFNTQGQSPYISRYADLLGNGGLTLANLPQIVSDSLRMILSHKGFDYLASLLLPTGFMALAGWPVLLIGLVSIAENVLSGDSMTTMQGQHYVAPLIPIVYAASATGVGALCRWLGRGRQWRSSLAGWLPLALSSVVLVASLWVGIDRGFTPLARGFVPQEVSAHHRLAQRFFDQILPEVSVTTGQALNPHLTHRQQITIMPFDFSGEYLLFDLTRDWPNSLEPEGAAWLKANVAENPAYGLIDAADGFALYRKGAPFQPLPDSFFDFLRAGESLPEYPAQVDFGDRLRFLGFDLVRWREGEGGFRLYWQALAPLPDDIFIRLYLADSQYELKGAVDLDQKELIWYPPSRWEPGETITVLVDLLPWDSRSLGEYNVALGVLSTRDPWDAGKRLVPTVHEYAQSPRLLDNGTLLNLLHLRWKAWRPEPLPEPRQGDMPGSATPNEVQVGPFARLLGYQLERTAASPGETLAVELFWRATRDTATDYTVFVHLVGPDGRLYGQRDNPPGSGTLLTSRWQPNDLIRDTYRLEIAPDAPAGAYRLAVGMYDPTTLQRLAVQGSTATAVEITRLEIAP